ncbi:MAG TPA: amino acid adenylation domain-containing protein, partial [Gammaproteobacteria bacterium]|nr:amino acid adenylation domain-containing protein [Gammaproteobacteria bacterium]
MKKLRLLIVGDQEILSDYLMTTLELGHDILTCFTNSQLTKEFCEKETICYHDLNGLKLIKQYEFDYCIVFSNLKLDISLMQSTMDKWILLHQKSTYSLQSKEFIDPFESYNDEVDYWQLYSQQMSELTVIKQDTFTEEERNINEHLYQLLVNLSREDLQFHTMYAKYTKNIPSLLLTQLTDYSTQLKIDIKILLISALYALITRYFSFKSEQLRLGFILTKNSIESGLAREVLFLSNNCDESLHFETFARFLFQEIVMHTMKNELSILNKNQKKFEMVFCLSINSNKISCIPSVIFQFDFDAENIYINIAYLNENYEKVNTTVLLDNFLLFLKAIIFSQGLRLSEIKFLPDINQATNKNIKIPCVATVLELFEKNVKNFSGNIAVIDGDKTFTYHALEVAATSIADKLRELGVTKETFIPLLSDRSFELIAGIIGIMKAGACYVPISPKLPSERVQYILKLTQAHLILCGSDNNNIAESIDKSIKVLLLKEVLNETTRLSPLFPLIVDSNNLAYLLFTSGTTGLPKGVAVDHASLADRLIWIKKKFSINQHDVVMNHTSISFDVSLEEIFLPLISGGKLVLAPNHVHEQIDKFSYLINFYKITYIEFVPSLLTLVLELNDFNTCSSLKYVISGGEPLTYGLLNKFQFNCKATLVNLYGPTECTINAAYYICQPTNIKRHGYVPIGYPIDNLQFHVLDQCQQPVPIGGIGELYISGTGVARGYLKENLIIEDCCIYNNEQLNLYKTGDLVRYTKDFSLEFIGRVDRQIKLRGYRIELDEIECILAKYPNIKQVALIAQDEENNKKQLVAFLTSTYADKTLAENFSEKIKIFCRQFLPSYMIPNDFILIEDMLFTQSGKIDYSALSKLYLSMQSELLSTKTTGTELEDLIKKIWSEVLNRNIGLEDNFFDFGGNSLSAAQATVMLTKKQLQINVVNIFQYPTIKNLMTYINEEKTPYLKQSKIFPVFNKKKIPLSYAQHRLWYLYQLEGNDNSAYNISMAFSIKGKLNILYLESAIHRLIERHQILRTVFKSEDGTPWQELVPDFHKKLIVNINSNIDKELVKEAHLPFDIENGPLFRFKLYEITPQHHVFIITMHNIITDGWSESIIIDEINQTYRALVEGKPISLQPLTVQYTDYAYWQKQNFNSQYLKDKLEYWVKKLDGANEVKLFYDATG